jgi:Holliday junction resolvase RusA-like endonuclease
VRSAVIRLIVNAVPIAQPRARATSRGAHAAMYSPTTVKTKAGRKPHPIVAFKNAVRAAAVSNGNDGTSLIDSALRVDCCFVFPRPQRLLKKSSPKCRLPHVIKPDRDNLDKAVLDSLTGLVWVDDCQAYSGLIEKFYVAAGEDPHVVIVITKIGFICD